MMSAITELGRVGITAVGATADEAEERYADAETGCGTRRRQRPLPQWLR